MLLIVEDIWQAHYQILSIVVLKEFIELNVNTDMIIKNVNLAKLYLSTGMVFLNTQVLTKTATKTMNKFDEMLKERFYNTYKKLNHDKSEFILLLGKVVYPKEYMDDWEKFNETSLPGKEYFYSHLDLADINDADFAHLKRVCEDFEIEHFREYHDLYFESNTLLLADVF